MLLLAALFTGLFTFAGDVAVQSAASAVKPQMVIGYCQGEEYYEFDYALNYLILALEEKGMIGSLGGKLSFDTPCKETWELLGAADQSSWQVKFSKEAFYTLSDSKLADLSREELHDKIRNTALSNNVGLMVVCGTAAALTVKDLSDNFGIISLAAADPLKSQIVKAVETSQTENVWALMDTDAFKRSVMVMNDILRPKTVGIVYANNEDAYIYSGVDVVDKFALDNNITVKKRFVDDPVSDSDANMQTYYSNLMAAYEELSREVDVFIMTTSLIEPEKMKGLFEPFYRRGVPIYSINSPDDVEAGALMAAESSDYENIGRFAASNIESYMQGKKLSELPQVYQTAPYLVFNYSTAKRIDYKADFKMLLVASEIYRD